MPTRKAGAGASLTASLLVDPLVSYMNIYVHAPRAAK